MSFKPLEWLATVAWIVFATVFRVIGLIVWLVVTPVAAIWKWNGDRWLSFLSLLLTVAGFGLTIYQLMEANKTLEASNTISLNAQARSVAEKLNAAGSDELSLLAAYDYYGDYLAGVGLLADKDQIDPDLWQAIVDEFCRYLKEEPGFQKWYASKTTAPDLLAVYPEFGKLVRKCP